MQLRGNFSLSKVIAEKRVCKTAVAQYFMWPQEGASIKENDWAGAPPHLCPNQRRRHILAHACTHTYTTCTHAHRYPHTCILAHTHTGMNTCTGTCMHTHAHPDTHTCTLAHAHSHTHTHAHRCSHMHTHPHMHTCTHRHAHT